MKETRKIKATITVDILAPDIPDFKKGRADVTDDWHEGNEKKIAEGLKRLKRYINDAPNIIVGDVLVDLKKIDLEE